MNRISTTLAMAAALLGAGLIALPAQATAARGPTGTFVLNDTAKAFSKDADAKGQAILSGSHFDRSVHLIVETFPEVPTEKKAEFEKATDKKKFYRDWAKELYRKNQDRGIYVQIVMTGHIEVVVDDQTAERRHFSNEDSNTLAKKFADAFRKAKDLKGEEAQAARDQGLVEAAEFVVSQLKGTKVGSDAAPVGEKKRSGGIGGMSIGGWICLGLFVLLGAWLVIGVIRAFTGGGGGGSGPGGGGGFMTSLFGGLFGAMAGMWLYNSMFGHGGMFGGASDAYAGDSSGYGDSGGDYGAGDTGGDYGGSADFGGGDFGGGDFGGGDF